MNRTLLQILGLALFLTFSGMNSAQANEGLIVGPGVGASAAAAGGGGKIADQPCDPRYWDSLKAKAWLEAEREIIQNQNLIFKPDSVLEYVCFDKFVDHTAAKGGDIFVHTKYFGREIITRGSNESMETGLKNVVYDALKAYDDGSFKDNKFFADRYEHFRNKSGDDNYPHAKAPTSGGSYSCNVMQNVWKTAKCINFIDNKEKFAKTDGFYPFKAIKPFGGGKIVEGYEDSFSGDNDVRQWPANLKCAGPTKDEWKLENDNNKNTNTLYVFKAPLAKDFEKVRKRIEPGGCKDGGTIKTGVKIIINGKETGEDGVCTNPGCTYKEGKCS